MILFNFQLEKLNKIMEVVLVWFRNNLRLADQPLLTFSRFSRCQVIPVFIFEEPWFQPTAFGSSSMGPHRFRFLSESIQTLRDSLNELGLPLLVRRGNPESILMELCRQFKVTEFRYQREPGVYEQQLEYRIEQVMIEKGILIRDIPVSTLIDATTFLHQPELLPNQFTAFRKLVEKQLVIPAMALSPTNLVGPIDLNEAHLPSAAEVGLPEVFQDSRADVYYKGGEKQAAKRLELFIESGAIDTYYDTRNQLHGPLFSSQLSPWLANGCISARQIYAAIQTHEREQGANKSTYWLFFELLWRDFFKLSMIKMGNKYFIKHGLKSTTNPNHHNRAQFENWCHGQTTNELVNAAMLQLKATGFMSNRMRQVVASYFVNDLQQDWRYGAAWFEHWLIDYDVSSNYGNWTYLAGVGNDPRNHRYFDVEKQARLFDADNSFRKRWLLGAQNEN